MNTTNILLSSTVTSTNIYLSSASISDSSNVVFSLSAVDKSRVPLSLKIRWGDTSDDEYYANDFFVNFSTQSVLDQIQYQVNYTLFKDYSHIYYPSNSSLLLNLSCQLLVSYHNGTQCRFIQPLTIYSPSFYAKMGNLNLINTSFISTDKSLLYTLIAETGSVTDLVFDSERSISN